MCIAQAAFQVFDIGNNGFLGVVRSQVPNGYILKILFNAYSVNI